MKPSDVKVSLTVLDWKKIIAYMRSYVANPENFQLTNWAETIIETIKTSVPSDIRDQSPMSVTLKPSVWRTMLKVLRPMSKHDSKEHKDFIVGKIQFALDTARQCVIVTTGDLKDNYEVIGPVYFQVSNKGLFTSQLDKLIDQYHAEIKQMRSAGQVGDYQIDWGFLYGEWSVGQSLFEQAFYVAVQELKKRALMLDADNIIAMRQDIDLDTTAFQYFYLQIYGTAVRLIE